MKDCSISLILVVSLASASGWCWLPACEAQTTNSALVERGRYLVEGVAICFECHSERDTTKPGWPIPHGQAGGGRILFGAGTRDQLVAPNISPDKETGIGLWSDSEIVGAIIGGVDRSGRALNPEMPYLYYRGLTAYDLRSIIAYLRSIPPVKHQLPANPIFQPGLTRETVAMESLKLSKMSAQVKRGQYLVRAGACETCHSPRRNEGFIRGLEFAGGVLLTREGRTLASSNLTPSASGLQKYSRQQFLSMMRNGRTASGELFSAMPWLFYGKMNDDDLIAIFEYLKSVPPVEHRINNQITPTLCKKCGNRHGLGDQN